MTLLEDLGRLNKELNEMAQTVDHLADQTEHNRAAIALHEEQISGNRGLSAAIDALATEVKSLRKAAYWVAGIIVAGSITFGFSVITLIGGHL